MQYFFVVTIHGHRVLVQKGYLFLITWFAFSVRFKFQLFEFRGGDLHLSGLHGYQSPRYSMQFSQKLLSDNIFQSAQIFEMCTYYPYQQSRTATHV